jgi:alanine-glyoxylate transaminase/serine-glyoxylate transaminase/serine-pyruvate transaminase
MRVADLPAVRLMGPGPSPVPPRVLAALAHPTLGHLDPRVLALMDEVRAGLQLVFGTQNPLTLAMSGTGSAGMETVLVNLIEPGDRVLVGVCGVFGERLAEVARRAGAEVTTVTAPWGQPIAPAELTAAIARNRPALVALVHAETSTGVHQPLGDIAAAAHAAGALFVLDCVTSLAGAAVEVDAWDVDAAYAGTQKCLSCPPGLAPVTFGPRAVERLARRTRPVQSWYLDLTMVQKYWGSDRVYHHTAPVNMLYALHEALAIVREEGLAARIERHRRVHARLADGLAARGLDFIPPAGVRLPMLNAISVPAGLDDVAARRALLLEHGVEIGGGLGAMKGKAWRVGLMGHGATDEAVDAFLTALDAVRR